MCNQHCVNVFASVSACWCAITIVSVRLPQCQRVDVQSPLCQCVCLSVSVLMCNQHCDFFVSMRLPLCCVCCPGCSSLALPAHGAEGDTSRCQTVQHPHQPQGAGEDLWLWHQRLPGGLHCADERGWVPTIHGGERDSCSWCRNIIAVYVSFPDLQNVAWTWVFSRVWWCCLCFQPERINPEAGNQGYDIKSDVWSLGITMVSTGSSVWQFFWV